MTIERRNFPQFFITAAAPCPYLPGRFERKVFTHLIGNDARRLNNELSLKGFRRSQNIAYRPACDGCSACLSVRVRVNEFRANRSQRRTLARNADLIASDVRMKATSEQYSLFRSYIDARHGDGGMADMTILDFAAMVDDTYVDSHLIEYRLQGPQREGELAAAVLIDILEDGISMIYSFYDPELEGRSLGTFMILDQIHRARRLGLPYVYLGYWIKGSRKMSYKANFRPQERLMANIWVLTEEDPGTD